MDKIFINELSVSGILGIHTREQKTPQEIRVSVSVSTDIRAAASDDDIRQTVNYSTLAKFITHFIEAHHFLTIEALIETLADAILDQDGINKIWLRVEKPNAIPEAASVGVEITRKKSA